MKKNKPKPEPKYAPIIAMSPEPRTTVLAKPVKPERQQSQAPDQGAEDEDHACCFHRCPEPGTIHIGPNGGDSHSICFRHLERWNQNRARFLADGGGCEMEELGELLDAPE